MGGPFFSLGDNRMVDWRLLENLIFFVVVLALCVYAWYTMTHD